MENVIASLACPPLPNFSDLLEGLRSHLSRGSALLVDSFRRTDQRAACLRKQTLDILDATAPLMDGLPGLIAWIAEGASSPAIAQSQLYVDFTLRDILTMLERLLFRVQDKKILNSAQYKKLKQYTSSIREYCQILDKILLARSESPEIAPKDTYTVGDIPLRTPLRVFIEDDDSGKYISCLEVPQVYGFGETEAEAHEMLDREILSLREDVKESESVADEYMFASLLIDRALING